jgi:O-antigen biosynthesis protein
MKILITNTTLCNFFGSQIFTYTMAMELKELGHEVFCFTSALGQVANRLQENGIPVYLDVAHIPDDIDIIHAHHRHETLLAFAGFQQTPMVLVCHGVLPLQEQPFHANMNIRRYVAVSEEVRNHLIESHGIASSKISIVRNGIDLTRFSCKKPINRTLKSLLVLSNNSAAQQLNVIQQACEERGIQFRKIGFPAANVWNVEDYINEADLVVTLGRGVLEAAACKRIVVVYDYNGGDGLVTQDSFPLFRQKSFSGRTNRVNYTVEQFKDVLDQYDPDIAEQVYQYIPELNASVVAKRYLQIYEEAIIDFNSNPIPARMLCTDTSRSINEVIKSYNDQISLLKLAVQNKIDEFDDLTGRFIEKCQDVTNRGRDITQLSEQIQQVEADQAYQSEQRLSAFETALKDRDTELASRNERIRHLEEELARAEESRKERENRLLLMDGELVERDGRIRQIEENIVRANESRIELENKLQLMGVELSDRDARIRQIEDEMLLESRRVEEHFHLKEETLREMAGELQFTSSLFQTSEADISRISAEREAERSYFEQQLKEREQRIEDLLNSKSWKVTAPLRVVLDLLANANQHKS